MRKLWHRLRKATGQAVGAVAFAFLATAMAALFAGIVLVGRAGTAGLEIAPPSHRALLHNVAAHPGEHAARMAVEPLIVAEASAQTAVHVAIPRPGDVPGGSFVRVQGLPPATSLSRGHPMGPGTWAVPLAQLSDLQLKAAANAAGKAKVTFTLVAAHGETLAEARTTLMLQTATARATPAARAASARLEPEPPRVALRRARGEPAPATSSGARDATPRLLQRQSKGRKHVVRHIGKRHHQIASSRARKLKPVRTVEDTFILFPFTWWAG